MLRGQGSHVLVKGAQVSHGTANLGSTAPKRADEGTLVAGDSDALRMVAVVAAHPCSAARQAAEVGVAAASSA